MAVKSAKNTDSISLCREHCLHKKFSDCPHIIRCLGSDYTIHNGEIYKNIFMEYASDGNLHDKIASAAYRGSRMSETEARKYTESILLGLRFIHSHGYVHCDIKPRNILIVDGMAKIGDFGMALKAGIYEGTINGTLMYMAPESTKRDVYEWSADVWGLGCTLFEMLTSEKYWRRRRRKEDESEETVEQWNMSREALSFIGKCLMEDSRMRWDCDMLLRHPFIVGNHVVVVDDGHDDDGHDDDDHDHDDDDHDDDDHDDDDHDDDDDDDEDDLF